MIITESQITHTYIHTHTHTHRLYIPWEELVWGLWMETKEDTIKMYLRFGTSKCVLG
jgi:hypothetical protein